MVTKEIKQFVITQMKEADWEVEKFDGLNEYKSKHINIQQDTTISQKVTFLIKIPNGHGSYQNLKLNRKELGINYQLIYKTSLHLLIKICIVDNLFLTPYGLI